MKQLFCFGRRVFRLINETLRFRLGAISYNPTMLKIIEMPTLEIKSTNIGPVPTYFLI